MTSSVIRKIVFNFFCLCLLAAGGGAQYGLARAQNLQDNDNLKIIYSFGASILVAIMNKIIQIFLVLTSQL